jgi:hypothetical protein
MTRALAVLAALGAMALFVPFNSSSSVSAPKPRPGPVLMYGDSLLEEASPYVRSTDEVRAFGGTALCDWVDNIAKASVLEQPSVMVIEFVGNNVTPCMNGYTTPDQIRAKYEADMAELKQRVEAPILWVGPPRFRDRAPAAEGLYDSERRFVDAGEAVLANGTYTETLPCLPDEGTAKGCVNGRIRVRAPDGAHFATSASGYSPGGRRFADTIDEAVRDQR